MTTSVTFLGQPFEVLRFVYAKTRAIWPTAVAMADDGYIYADPLAGFVGIRGYTLYPFDLSDPEGLDMRPHVTIRLDGNKVFMDAVGVLAVDLVKRLSTLPVWSHRTEEVHTLKDAVMSAPSFTCSDPVTFSSPIREVLRLTDTSFIYLGVAIDDGGAAKQAFLAILARPSNPPATGMLPVTGDAHDAFLGDAVLVASPPAKITNQMILRCSGKTGEELLRITNDGIVVADVIIENPHSAHLLFMDTMTKIVADG